MGQAAAKEVAHGPQYKTNVMFLCNHNSCRSQMADGWLRQLRGDAEVGVLGDAGSSILPPLASASPNIARRRSGDDRSGDTD